MIEIELVYALPEKAICKKYQLMAGLSLSDFVQKYGILSELQISLETHKIGVWGTKIADDYPLKNGDRIEIYRDLLNDPKEIRKIKAKNKN